MTDSRPPSDEEPTDEESLKRRDYYFEISNALLNGLIDSGISPQAAGASLWLTLGRIFACKRPPDSFTESWLAATSEGPQLFFKMGFDYEVSQASVEQKLRRRFFKCRGCGGIAIEYIDAHPPHIPAGAVGHTKPIELANIPNTVPCSLYNQLSARDFLALHEDAEPVEEPVEFKSMEN